MNKNKKTIFWRKVIPVDRRGDWEGRLCDGFVETELADEGKIQLDCYCLSLREAAQLKKQWGGVIKTLTPRAWLKPRKFLLRAGDVEVSSEKKKRKFSSKKFLHIPAGMAFGTGEHATTRMCLEELIRRRKFFAKERVLDVGTGSGILALAASMLGCRTMGIDFDADSIREARLNAQRNKHVPRVVWKRSAIQDFKSFKKFDCVTANLFAECLIENMGKLASFLDEGGYLIVSGILKEEGARVGSAIKKAGLKPLKFLRRGKWVCWVGQRLGSVDGI